LIFQTVRDLRRWHKFPLLLGTMEEGDNGAENDGEHGKNVHDDYEIMY
jgi:hypothetical protein